MDNDRSAVVVVVDVGGDSMEETERRVVEP